MMEVRHLKKKFQENTVLEDINLSFKNEDVTCILGPSGAGKSTFLRCLNLLEKPTEGEILYEGRNLLDNQFDIRQLREEVGMVFQHFNLFPLKTAAENIMLAPRLVKKMGKKEARKCAETMLAKVGLADKADAMPSSLSGGQQQRIAIARALAMQPKMILFDEPTSALDPELVGDVLSVMRNLADEGMSMIIVTHEMNFAKEVADRIVFMADGRIIEDSAPGQFFSAPKTERAKTFLSRFLI
ncbi:amino acid ABC transporter ATP-binding protein [Pectinatus haikarae]|uniref:ABC-type polar amino acid transport system ATPase subunit n=1 Tax=Pectinatus haikarae TaxID=349096 RepID=A0ABT9Y4I0_9FIRM|nr:amino acid ABC transporter ATP-binding protein [Pectinatus haikarae]MDQ0202631.1 ABC-type polar amino acid transport system ATPase subunit [Pectinatus haikarae]